MFAKKGKIDALHWFQDRQILDVLHPVNREGSYQGETKCIPTTSSDSLFNTHSTVEDWRNLGKMKLNEPGRQKLGRQKPCKQAQHAKLHSDLLQAYGTFDSLGPPPGT